ncbi:MAG: M1 family metallopeptidase [Chitinophagaceae bacterium]
MKVLLQEFLKRIIDQSFYLSGENETKPLVRFYYKDREDLFDAVSYNKGGRVLHMLRNLLGDSAFFNGLRLYLNTYRFKAAEAHQLRLAMEEVSGRDLNWFFNQWYYGSGHPKLSIEYLYNDAAQQVKVVVQQTQTTPAAFRFPLAIDLYQGATRKRYSVWVEHRTDTFLFSYDQRPDLINVDAEKILLAEKKDPKTLSQYFHQYKYAGNYVDRREAIEFALQQQEDSIAQQLLLAALQDSYKGLRNLTLSQLDLEIPPLKAKAESLILLRAEKDPDPVVRAAAIQLLSKYNREKYHNLFLAAAEDSSYTLAGAGLAALHQLDPQLAEPILNHLIGQPKKGKLLAVWINLMLASTDEKILTEIVQSYARMDLNQEKFDLTLKLCEWLGKTNSTSLVKAGVDAVIKFRNALPEQFGLGPVFNNLLQGIISKKEAALTLALNKGVYQEQIEYIRKKLSTKK